MPDTKTEGWLQKNRGRVRETWGKITDDDIDKSEGQMDKLIGTIKEKTGDTYDAIRAKFDEWTKDDDDTQMRKAS